MRSHVGDTQCRTLSQIALYSEVVLKDERCSSGVVLERFANRRNRHSDPLKRHRIAARRSSKNAESDCRLIGPGKYISGVVIAHLNGIVKNTRASADRCFVVFEWIPSDSDTRI